MADIKVQFKGLTGKEIETLFEIEKLFAKLGITFDTGFAVGKNVREWKWDWSLKGPVKVEIVKAAK